MDFAGRTVTNFLPTVKRKPLSVVAAIDFGTTFTGYAVSFNNGENIITGRDGDILPTERVVSCVLLNGDKTFNSFGNEALDMFCDMSQNDKRNCYLFEMFKMELYKSKELSRETLLHDRENKTVSAFFVFKLVIKYLMDLVHLSIRTFVPPDSEINILWMLSVPAIWLESARQFMREVAVDAGIPEEDLRLVLEPEAASLHCRNQLMRITKSDSIDNLPVGYKYILADLGGGTVDICAHEILENGKLRELYRATGNDCGGSCVDSEFSKFMAEIFGRDVWSDFQEKYFSKYKSLMKSFQDGKNKFSSQTDSISINIGHNLISVYGKHHTDSFEKRVSVLAECVEFDPEETELTISSNIAKHLFQYSIAGITEKLTEVIEACALDNIENVLFVGGFAMSEYVREKIEEVIQPLRTVLEQDARLAVLKGSVMMGFKPRNIIQRRSRFTYGFAASRKFVEGVHPPHLKFVRDVDMISSIFRRLIMKDQIVEYNQTFVVTTTSHFMTPASKAEELCFALYRSTNESPEYCTDTGCQLVGEIIIKPPTEGWPDVLIGEDHLIAGETEFLIKAFNKTTGQRYEAHMDFL